MKSEFEIRTDKRKPRVLLAARYSSIEPLGIAHLLGTARDEGWDREVVLIKNDDFTEFEEKAPKFDIVGVNAYTGFQNQVADSFRRIRRATGARDPRLILGGPFATYFPTQVILSEENPDGFADDVVMSEGFGVFAKILRGELKPGIHTTPNVTSHDLTAASLPNSEEGLFMHPLRRFPLPDRKTLYDAYPELGNSPIKSIITMTGCPYTCTYCYNSSSPGDINLPTDLARSFAEKLGMGGRLFPKNIRGLEDILKEGRELVEKWSTKLVYVQDDVFGFDTSPAGFLEQFSERWPREVGLPFHAQMRWEMTRGSSGDKRLELTKKAGGHGLTFAIESHDPLIRKEVLDRGMSDEDVLGGVIKVVDNFGFKLRTEQISALPTGITTHPTAMNLDADLALLDYNIALREATRNGDDNMTAWFSTYAPYVGTKLGNLAITSGFYTDRLNGDVREDFFSHSVLRFRRKGAGPEFMTLHQQLADPRLKGEERVHVQAHYEEVARDLRENPDHWLSEEDNEIYRRQNGEFRKKAPFFFSVPGGAELARSYLINMDEPYSYRRLGAEAEAHLYRMQRTHPRAAVLLRQIGRLRSLVHTIAESPGEAKLGYDLVPYFGSLLDGEEIMRKFFEYAKKDNRGYAAPTLSDSTRHGIYEMLLYKVSKPTGRESE